MLRTAAPRLELIHELHVVLNQSGLMRYADISHSFLAMTKESVYSDEPQPLVPREGSERRYLIVYPMWKRRRSEEHTSELQSLTNLVCRLLLEKKNSTRTETR